MTDKPAAPQPNRLAAFRALAEKWDKDTAECTVTGVWPVGATESVADCADELRALIAQEEGSNRADSAATKENER